MYVYIAVLLIVLCVYFCCGARHWGKGVKEPAVWYPFIGNGIELYKNKDNIFNSMWEFTKTCGGQTWGLSVPGQRWIFVTTEEQINYLLKTKFTTYAKGKEFQAIFNELLGEGIFSTDGDAWRSHRKAASHMFSLRRLSTHAMESFISYAKVAVELLDTKEPNEVFDIQRVFFAYTFDAFSAIAFGQQMSCIKTPHPFPAAFDRLNTISSTRVLLPPLLWRALRFFSLGEESDTQKNVDIINKYVSQVITSRLNKGGDGEVEVDEAAYGSDLLGLFIGAYKKRESKVPSAKALRDVVMNFMLAGRDTTAWTLTAMLVRLLEHPDVMKRVVDEIDSLNFSTLSPEYGDLSQLVFLEKVMMETLRLYPSVPAQFKYALEKDILPGGIDVEAGDLVAYSSYIMGRLQHVWGDDAEEFKPDRWDPVMLKKISDCKYPAFNVGKRNCLGKPMAIMESKLLLATLFKRYTFSLVPGHSETYTLGATLCFRHGLRVKVARR